MLPDAALPLFPLRVVLFPDALLELKVFEARYLDLMTRCMRERRPFGVATLRHGREAGAPGEPIALYGTGTLAELIEVDSVAANILMVRCRGTQRFTLGATRQEANGLWVGEATGLADDPQVAPGEAQAHAVKSLQEAIATLKAEGAEPFLEPHRFESAGWVANRWCEILPLLPDAKQQLLAMPDPRARLDVVDSLMRSGQASH